MHLSKKILGCTFAAVLMGMSSWAYAATETQATVDTAASSQSQQALININTANEKQLISIKGLGSKKAQAIIAYRDKNGDFKTVQDLTNVAGIGPGLLKKIQAQVTVG